MSRAGFLCAVLLAGVLLGCGKPVPQEKAAYVGEWKAPGMYLPCSDGSVQYNDQIGRHDASTARCTVSTATIRVRVGLWRTTFVVRAPYRTAER